MRKNAEEAPLSFTAQNFPLAVKTQFCAVLKNVIEKIRKCLKTNPYPQPLRRKSKGLRHSSRIGGGIFPSKPRLGEPEFVWLLTVQIWTLWNLSPANADAGCTAWLQDLPIVAALGLCPAAAPPTSASPPITNAFSQDNSQDLPNSAAESR